MNTFQFKLIVFCTVAFLLSCNKKQNVKYSQNIQEVPQQSIKNNPMDNKSEITEHNQVTTKPFAPNAAPNPYTQNAKQYSTILRVSLLEIDDYSECSHWNPCSPTATFRILNVTSGQYDADIIKVVIVLPEFLQFELKLEKCYILHFIETPPTYKKLGPPSKRPAVPIMSDSIAESDCG